MSLRLVSIGGILPKKERALNGAAMANDVIANNVTTGSPDIGSPTFARLGGTIQSSCQRESAHVPPRSCPRTFRPLG
jgi:hypothetical protein